MRVHGIFFFKQKTAYEMRISDWSSDVCSSDLAVRLMKALQDYRITNMSAAATHYRMMKNTGKAGDFKFHFKKLSFTGEPIDPATLEWIDENFKVPACSMYGTTEIGVVLVNYPGAPDYVVKPRSEEHTSELQSLMRISYAVFCLKKKTTS